MDRGRWALVVRLYQQASEWAPGERSAFLTEACTGDEALLREVESLLMQDVSQDGVLERVAQHSAVLISGRAIPRSVGRYRILRMIGEGGMGVVYEAEQDHPHRTVALKLLKPGLPRSELFRRFDRESEALGRLQHPGIAQVFEAGAAETNFGSQPYFAMELVRGLSLLEYAKTHSVNTRQRLEILAKTCDAVQHAHQRGIIHRDLKPSNILVDEVGQPKILDFGVARIADTDLEATRQTHLGELVGTIAYMSPEQVLGDPLEVDARIDIYSLGVVLYELLSGRLPYQVGHNMCEAARTIREEKPALLSATNRTYRGDLETIVQKALEKDKTRRYASAAEFAADIRRLLADEPVLARPPSTSYQLKKFAIRHKALVGALTAVFIVLVLGVLVSTREAILADRERNRALEETRRADTEAATAKALNDFLQNDLLAKAAPHGQSGPNTKPDPELRVRTALDRAAAGIDARHDLQAAVEGAIRDTIGTAYSNLGLFQQAEAQLERALALRRKALGPDHRDTLRTARELAGVYGTLGHYEAAESLLIPTVDTLRRVRGDRDSDTIVALQSLALLATEHRGNYANAEALLAKTLDIQLRVLGAEHPETISSMNDLAVEYENQGKYAPAEKLYKQVVELMRRVLGPEHPDTLRGVNNLGVTYRQQGKYADAEIQIKTALEARRRLEGEEHLDTIASLNSLALLYQAEGKYAKAEPLLKEVLDTSRKTLGPDQQNTLGALNNLADLYVHEGRLGEAEAIYVQVLDARRRVLAPEHPRIARVLTSLGELKLDQHAYADAEPFLREALKVREKGSPNAWERYYAQSLLGAVLAAQTKYAEAEPLLISGYEGLVKRQNSTPFEDRKKVERARLYLIQLYERWGKPEQTARWREPNPAH